MDRDGVWEKALSQRFGNATTRTRGSPDKDLTAAQPADLCSAKLLTPTEERQLFCSMNYFKYRANAIRATVRVRRPSTAKLNQIEHLLTLATEIRNRIVTANTRLVVSIVKPLVNEKNSFDDLFSEGTTCLIKTIDKFDFGRGFRFSTYATLAVRREVYRWVQRSHRTRYRFMTDASEVLRQQVSSDQPVEESGPSWAQTNRCVRRLMKELSEREQFIIQARYGFMDLGQKPTFAKLGEMLGVSKERVRQLELRAMGKLRDRAPNCRVSPNTSESDSLSDAVAGFRYLGGLTPPSPG